MRNLPPALRNKYGEAPKPATTPAVQPALPQAFAPAVVPGPPRGPPGPPTQTFPVAALTPQLVPPPTQPAPVNPVPLGPVPVAAPQPRRPQPQPLAEQARAVITNFESLPVGRGAMDPTVPLPRPDSLEPAPECQIPAQPSEAQQRLQNFAPFQPPSWVVQPTMAIIPASGSARTSMHLPLGCVIQPLAEPPHGEEEVPVVNFESAGVIRCKRCRTYVNPFVTWTEGGRSWLCNVCTVSNEVPNSYYCQIDERGQRYDVQSRPELRRGVYEVVATPEYTVRTPQTPSFLFVIDVGQAAVNSGMIPIASQVIRACLDSIPGRERAFVGFVTFDSTVHVYDLKPGLSLPQAIAMPDLLDPFLPLPDHMLVNVAASRAPIEAFLDVLPNMYADTQVQTSCLGTALQTAYMIQKHIGGRMLVFTASLPMVGLGVLKNREDPRAPKVAAPNSSEPPSLLSPSDPWYTELSRNFTEKQICADLFMFNCGTYLDAATLGVLARSTCGQTYLYNGVADSWGDRFSKELTRVLTRTTGFEAVMRVRTSKGLQIGGYYGHYTLRNSDLLVLPNIDPDKSFGVRLAHADATLGTNVVYIQAALLYTTHESERRIRVITLCLPVSNSIVDVYDHVSSPTISNLFAKSVIAQVHQQQAQLSTVREKLQQQCTDIFRNFRVHCPTEAKQQGGNLLFHKSLALLPLYVLGILKCYAFRPNMSEPNSDIKSYLMMLVNTMTDAQVCRLIVPRLFPLHTINLAALDGAQPDQALSHLPPAVPTSYIYLDPAGVYVLDGAYYQYVWVGSQAPPQLAATIITNPQSGTFSPSDSPEGRGLVTLLNAMGSGSFPQRAVFVQGAQSEGSFVHLLVEDKNQYSSGASYGDFLVFLQNQVAMAKS